MNARLYSLAVLTGLLNLLFSILIFVKSEKIVSKLFVSNYKMQAMRSNGLLASLRTAVNIGFTNRTIVVWR